MRTCLFTALLIGVLGVGVCSAEDMALDAVKAVVIADENPDTAPNAGLASLKPGETSGVAPSSEEGMEPEPDPNFADDADAQESGKESLSRSSNDANPEAALSAGDQVVAVNEPELPDAEAIYGLAGSFGLLVQSYAEVGEHRDAISAAANLLESKKQAQEEYEESVKQITEEYQKKFEMQTKEYDEMLAEERRKLDENEKHAEAMRAQAALDEAAGQKLNELLEERTKMALAMQTLRDQQVKDQEAAMAALQEQLDAARESLDRKTERLKKEQQNLQKSSSMKDVERILREYLRDHDFTHVGPNGLPASYWCYSPDCCSAHKVTGWHFVEAQWKVKCADGRTVR